MCELMADFETQLNHVIYWAARTTGLPHLSNCPSMRVTMPPGEWEGMELNVVAQDDGQLFVVVDVSCDDGNHLMWTYGTLADALAVGTADPAQEAWAP